MRKLVLYVVAAAVAFGTYKWFSNLSPNDQKQTLSNAEGKIRGALPAEHQKTFDEILAKGKTAVETVTQAKVILNTVMQSNNIQVVEETWIEKQLSSKDPSIRDAMQPILIEVYKRVPHASDWARIQIERQAREVKDAGKARWEAALSEIRNSTQAK